MTAKAHPDEVVAARKRVRAGETVKKIAHDLGRSTQWVWLHTRDIRKAKPSPRRPHIVAVRLTDAELDRLDKAARANGRSHGAEIRSLLSGAKHG